MMTDEIWAITSYFNPIHWRRRSANFQIFRQHLQFPLVAIELGYDDQFDLRPDDAEILVQHSSADVMWQKERLLNIAMEALPAECQFVVWIDCDMVLQQTNLPALIVRELKHRPVAQLFSLVFDLEPDASLESWKSQSAAPRHSVASRVEQGMSAADCLGKRQPGPLGIRSPGHAWAIRRELIDRHGFYDACIIGGGDSALACAAYGVFPEVIRLNSMNTWQISHYINWAEAFHKSVQGNVGLVEGDLVHFWHGKPADRRWFQRHADLAFFDFDPATDIALDESGCWRWNSAKPALHDYVRGYFVSRNEDLSVPEASLA
jgi:hypothetical protein